MYPHPAILLQSPTLFRLHPATPLLLCLSVLAAAPVGAQEGRLAVALDAVRAEHLRADVHFFADEELGGRDTPSPELEIAARFVRARLERLGFTPGAGESFFYEYELASRRLDTQRSHIVVAGHEGSTELEFGADYFFHSTRDVTELSLSAGVLFVGTGDRRELEGLDLSGKWALTLGADVPVNRRKRYVQRADAAGLLVVPLAGDESPAQRFENTTELAKRGQASFVKPGSRPSTDQVFPQVFLSRAAGLGLLASAGCADDELDELDEWQPVLGTELQVTVSEERRGGGRISVENVCGLWPGTDLADEVIIVSAHYDHVGTRGEEIWNGADDNGSGSMGLLAIAEALVAYGPMRRSVLLMWVSGEEKGLWGSYAWTTDPLLPPGARAVCDLNIDMIGRNDPDYLLITPSRDHEAYNGLTRLAEDNALAEGFVKLGSADPWWARSDHMNFANNLEIPVAFLFSGEHEDYHQPTDTPDKLDYDKIRRVSRLVVRMLDGLQADELDL